VTGTVQENAHSPAFVRCGPHLARPDTCIKFSAVVADIFGVSGRDMLAVLVGGERDPKVLAQLARRSMRAKIAVLEEAFTGHFTDHHAFLPGTMLRRVDAISADIAALDERIAEQAAPLADAIARLDEIPGDQPGQRVRDPGRNRHRYDPVPHRRAPGLVGPAGPGHRGTPAWLDTNVQVALAMAGCPSTTSGHAGPSAPAAGVPSRPPAPGRDPRGRHARRHYLALTWWAVSR
jgi:hypothetical protein